MPKFLGFLPGPYLARWFMGKDKNGVSRFDNVLNGLLGKYTGANMTPADRQMLDYQDDIADENATVAYMRQKEFQEQYLTPEAQIKSQAKGYESVGLNKMALAGTNPGASASSAPESSPTSSSPTSSDVSSLLGTIIGSFQKGKQIRNDYEIGMGQLDVAKQQAATSQYQAETDRIYKMSLTRGQDITNNWLPQLYGADVADKNASASLKAVQEQHFTALINSESVRQELMRHNIALIDVQKATQEYIKAQEKAKADNAKEYYDALAKLQTATALLQQGQYTIFNKTLNERIESAKAELNHIIIKAGMDAKIFTGEAFTLHAAGKMTSAEKWQAGLQFGSAVIGAAAGLAGSAFVGSGTAALGRAASLPHIIPGYAVDYQGYGFGPTSNVPAPYYGIPLGL